MKRLMLLTLAAALAATLASAGDAVFGYHGKLLDASGAAFTRTVPMAMAFKLYAGENETTPLWGRIMPVKVNAGGTFYVELADSTGSAVESATYRELVPALAAGAKREIWLGITPAGTMEITPRQRVFATLGAQYAQEALAIDTIRGGSLSVTGATTVAESFTANNVEAGSVSVDSGAHVNFAVPSGSARSLSASGEIRVAYDADWLRKSSMPVPTQAPTDMFIVWIGVNKHYGATFSLIYPKGFSVSSMWATGAYVITTGAGE